MGNLVRLCGVEGKRSPDEAERFPVGKSVGL